MIPARRGRGIRRYLISHRFGIWENVGIIRGEGSGLTISAKFFSFPVEKSNKSVYH